MNNKHIFDVDNINEFNDDELLRPMRKKVHQNKNEAPDFSNENLISNEEQPLTQKRIRHANLLYQNNNRNFKIKWASIFWAIFTIVIAIFIPFHLFTFTKGGSETYSFLTHTNVFPLIFTVLTTFVLLLATRSVSRKLPVWIVFCALSIFFMLFSITTHIGIVEEINSFLEHKSQPGGIFIVLITFFIIWFGLYIVILSKTSRKKIRPIAITWIVFTLLSEYFAQMLLDGSFIKLFKVNSSLYSLAIIGISITIWAIIFIIIAFITSKKSGIIALLSIFTLANAGVLQANLIATQLKSTASKTNVLKTSNKNVLSDPFTVLILGVDADDSEAPKSSSQPNSGYHSDSMTLVTINPKTHKADMVTTPRDSFLQDTCKNGTGHVHKLTEFINGGVQCTVDTIQKLYNVEVDFLIQANFNAVVQIVDSIGGVEVDVPDLTEGYITWLSNWINQGGDSDASVNSSKLIALRKKAKEQSQWCEVDSHRNPYVVCFDKFGKQNLSGEQALAYSRSRHYDSDYARSIRQTEVIKAIIQKIATPAGLTKITKVLDRLKANYSLETNMTFEQMNDIMAYSENLSGNDTANFQVRKHQPLGKPNENSALGSGIFLYKSSVNDIRRSLAITLGKEEPTLLSETEYYDTINYPAFKTNAS